MSIYIHQLPGWPSFEWKEEPVNRLLSELRFAQGKLLGKMGSLGFGLQAEASLQTLTLDVIKSSEIEGELLDLDQVRSSIAKRLGMDIGGLVAADRNVDGIVEMMLDATQNPQDELTADRLFGWHSSLFPAGRSGMHRIVTGAWRDNAPNDPMQVVSGAMGKEKVHFEAPPAEKLQNEMALFFDWFNRPINIDPVLKAGIAHIWFITVHPFDDGNGRIARAITDLQLARADGTSQRFYSMSAQIRKERPAYYEILERTQQNTLNITNWLLWFLPCLQRAIASASGTLEKVLYKAAFWEKHATSVLNSRQLLMLNKLLDGIDGKLNSSKWAKMSKCSSDTAVRDINDLLEKNILVRETGGGRSTSYSLA